MEKYRCRTPHGPCRKSWWKRRLPAHAADPPGAREFSSKGTDAMKKNLAVASVALLILAALTLQLSGAPMDEKEEKKEKKETVTVSGTVVDMHCYVTHGIRDAAHTACSNACIAR